MDIVNAETDDHVCLNYKKTNTKVKQPSLFPLHTFLVFYSKNKDIILWYANFTSWTTVALIYIYTTFTNYCYCSVTKAFRSKTQYPNSSFKIFTSSAYHLLPGLFLAWLILWPWRRRQHVLKYWLTFNGLHSFILQNIELFSKKWCLQLFL
jgi:hypothetical protein